MSDLSGGRASNGGARTGSGPVPVGGSGTPTGIKTPRDIMRDRNAREARRQEEQKAEEARRLAEERRKSAERRAAAVTGGIPRLGQGPSQSSTDMGAKQTQFDSARRSRSDSQRVSGADVLGEPVGRTQEYTRAPSAAQPKTAQSATAGARRTQQSQAAPRQASAQAAEGASTTQPPPTEQRTAPASFPHAFERWETLSSHWEGLTSYWLHKLEQNTEEIRTQIPNASTLNRQITDLSAAGANLFHAVVELQRLRASSERKFQRWFFETRADTERNQEMQGQLERQLRLERSAREEAATKRADAEEAAALAKREVGDMRRELMISKEEARRAWEELGRRNQEALDTAESLKAGRIAVVAGVQVVPYFGGPSRSGTGASQRPVTRDGPVPYGGSATGASSVGAPGLTSPVGEQEYYREERPSPTNTDPFTEQRQPTTHYDPHLASRGQSQGYQTYPAGGAAALAAATAATAQRGQATSASSSAPSRTQQPLGVSPPETQRFDQHPEADTFLHGQPTATAQQAPAYRPDLRSHGSYADTLSEGDTEYVLDSAGNIRYDEQGRPIVFQRQRGPQQQGQTESDDLEEEAMRHERELAAGGYGAGGQILPEAPSVPATSAQAMETYTPTTGAGSGEYEGQGYDSWDPLPARHHHPTRLSDVLEEEEERSSRRTGD